MPLIPISRTLDFQCVCDLFTSLTIKRSQGLISVDTKGSHQGDYIRLRFIGEGNK